MVPSALRQRAQCLCPTIAGTGARNWALRGRRWRLPMTQQDPFNPRPQHPPDVDPLPPGSNPPRYRDQDIAPGGNWNSGIIGAAIIAALVVIGLIMPYHMGRHRRSTDCDQSTSTNHRPEHKPAARSEIGQREGDWQDELHVRLPLPTPTMEKAPTLGAFSPSNVRPAFTSRSVERDGSPPFHSVDRSL